jgi:FtsH-binding integral membrane protein
MSSYQLIPEIDTIVFATAINNNIQNTRQSFIGKVYSTLWFQLFYSGCFITLSYFDPIHSFLIGDVGKGISVLVSYATIIHIVFMLCYDHAIRESPYSFYNLFMFTTLINYNLGYLSLVIEPLYMAITGIYTLTIFTGLSLYAIQTKIDYTVHGNILMIIFLSLILIGIFNIVIQNDFISILYSIMGVLIFSGFTIIDTQMIVNGKNKKYMLSEKDYVFAVITLYLDIINLFLYLIQILGFRD